MRHAKQSSSRYSFISSSAKNLDEFRSGNLPAADFSNRNHFRCLLHIHTLAASPRKQRQTLRCLFGCGDVLQFYRSSKYDWSKRLSV